MNQDIKKLWVDALRSGKYQQAEGALRISDGYCCLGVLCEVLKIPKQTQQGSNVYQYGRLKATTMLPIEACNLSRLGPQRNPLIKYLEVHTGLSYVNDKHVSFNDIANLIEEQL